MQSLAMASSKGDKPTNIGDEKDKILFKDEENESPNNDKIIFKDNETEETKPKEVPELPSRNTITVDLTDGYGRDAKGNPAAEWK